MMQSETAVPTLSEGLMHVERFSSEEDDSTFASVLPSDPSEQHSWRPSANFWAPGSRPVETSLAEPTPHAPLLVGREGFCFPLAPPDPLAERKAPALPASSDRKRPLQPELSTPPKPLGKAEDESPVGAPGCAANSHAGSFHFPAAHELGMPEADEAEGDDDRAAMADADMPATDAADHWVSPLWTAMGQAESEQERRAAERAAPEAVDLERSKAADLERNTCVDLERKQREALCKWQKESSGCCDAELELDVDVALGVLVDAGEVTTDSPAAFLKTLCRLQCHTTYGVARAILKRMKRHVVYHEGLASQHDTDPGAASSLADGRTVPTGGEEPKGGAIEGAPTSRVLAPPTRVLGPPRVTPLSAKTAPSPKSAASSTPIFQIPFVTKTNPPPHKPSPPKPSTPSISIGQCEKSPECVRGYKHSAQGGLCRFSLKPGMDMPPPPKLEGSDRPATITFGGSGKPVTMTKFTFKSKGAVSDYFKPFAERPVGVDSLLCEDEVPDWIEPTGWTLCVTLMLTSPGLHVSIVCRTWPWRAWPTMTIGALRQAA